MLNPEARPWNWRLVASLSILALTDSVWGVDNVDWKPDTAECNLNIPLTLQPDAQFGCPIPIDDTVELRPVRWSPWTHLPLCVNATADPAAKYCVFTNSRHGVGGISLITTPQVAADSVGILNEPVLSNVRLTNNTENDSSDVPYEMIDMPGKGKGIVAKRRISKHETFMVDYASMLVDVNFPFLVKREHGYPLLHSAADQLSDPQRVYALGKSDALARDVIENVLRTNAFQSNFASVPHIVLYPLVSRINHACRPNAFQRFVPRSLAATVAAARTIEPGEEITISYIGGGKTFVDRQAGLKRWGFKCSCDLCSAPGNEVSASDTRRLKIQSNHEKVVKAYENRDAATAVKLTHDILDLMREEDLFLLYAEQYENLARIYWASGNRENAQKYAKMSMAELEKLGFTESESEQLQLILEES